MFRRKTGSSLCPSCRKLNSVDAPVCMYCGRKNPGLWGYGPAVGRLLGDLNFARVVTGVSIAAYVASLLLNPRAAMHLSNPLDLLAPGGAALDALGMTGAYAWARGRWWTLFTAIYLHGSLLHILFNLLWINQLAPAVEELYGRSRLILIFTAAGVLGFVASNWIGIAFTIGASGSIFGLLGSEQFRPRRWLRWRVPDSNGSRPRRGPARRFDASTRGNCRHSPHRPQLRPRPLDRVRALISRHLGLTESKGIPAETTECDVTWCDTAKRKTREKIRLDRSAIAAARKYRE